MQRWLNNSVLLVSQNWEEKLVHRNELNQKFFDLIRIREEEYPEELEVWDFFDHFNLQKTWHEVWKFYYLPRVLRHWFFDPETWKEKLPILSFEEVYLAKCTRVEEKLKYFRLTDDYFTFSLDHIKSQEELKEIIQKRYSESMPKLSREEIFSLWIGYTQLEIVDKLTVNF